MSKTSQITGRTPSGNVVKMPKRVSRSQTSVTDFVRDHPGMVIAGGIVLGVVAASLLPRGTGRRLADKALGLAEVAGTASALLGRQARERAEATGSSLREQGGVVAERLEKLTDSASDRLAKLGDSASGRFGKLSDSAAAQVEKLIDPVEHAASRLAKKAAELKSRVRH